MTVAIGAKMLLDAAKVVEDRHKSYGPPDKNFRNIATYWNAWLATKDTQPAAEAFFTEADVAELMILVKLARLAETPDHLDSWTDIAGYAACGVEVACREAEPVPDIDRNPLPYWDNGASAKPNPSMPLVSEDVSEEDFNR